MSRRLIFSKGSAAQGTVWDRFIEVQSYGPNTGLDLRVMKKPGGSYDPLTISREAALELMTTLDLFLSEDEGDEE